MFAKAIVYIYIIGLSVYLDITKNQKGAIIRYKFG